MCPSGYGCPRAPLYTLRGYTAEHPYTFLKYKYTPKFPRFGLDIFICTCYNAYGGRSVVYRRSLTHPGLSGGRASTARMVVRYTLESMNMSTVDEKTVVVVVAGTDYKCTADVAEYVNNDSAPCHVVIRSPLHDGGYTLPPVYKGTGVKRDRQRAKLDKRSRLDWCEQTFREMILDKGIPSETVDKVISAYNGVRESIKHTSGKTVYKWTGDDLVDKVCSVPNASVRAIIIILTELMPQPSVQEIRDQFVHGTKHDALYTEEMSSFLAFAIWWTHPYAERKIMAFENERTGRVYGRTLHRTTDMGQQGRLFSDADISDVVNRTILLAFCPVICRAVPVSDKGSGYVILSKCTARKELGEHLCRTSKNKSTLCGREDALKARYKKYRCTESQYINATDKQRKHMITDQMYNDLMSELPSSYYMEAKSATKRVHNITESMKIRKGWWVVYTCSDTGQQFRVFTQSSSRAERLCSYTGITAEMDESIVERPKAGLFGVGEQKPTLLRADNIQRFTPQGVYFKTLKFMMYNIFEYLFRRAVEFNEMFSEHNTTRKAKRNYETEFSLYTFWLEAKNGRAFTNEQRDVMDVELTLPEHLPTGRPGYRRVLMYRDLVFRRTGHESTVSRWDYEKLKERVYSELRIIAEQDKAVAVQPFSEPLPGPGLFEVDESPVYVPRALPSTGSWYSDEIEISGLVKRTPEEIEELDNNPAVRKYSEYKTVRTTIPCWRSVEGDHVYIEQNHDDA